jgi:hypothetical protein
LLDIGIIYFGVGQNLFVELKLFNQPVDFLHADIGYWPVLTLSGLS